MCMLQLVCLYINLNNHFSLSTDDGRSVQPLSSVPSNINQSRAFSNLCQLFAWLVSVRAIEILYTRYRGILVIL